MQNSFNTAAAESFLGQGHYIYERRPDGTLLVKGNIDIARRNLHELPDLSCVVVTGNFYCQDNHLTSLKGAPKEVQGGFWCYGNQLESLEHTPSGITGQFVCSDNRLTSLKFSPAKIRGDFCCGANPLTSLEGAPSEFNTLRSRFGIFNKWDEVPEQLRYSPETIAAAAQKSLVLQESIRVLKPIVLRKPSR